VPVEGDYEPSTWEYAAAQVELYEGFGGTEGLLHEGKPCVILTTQGCKTGKVRKSPLMRVEHDGRYAVVASAAGATKHPGWYHNLVANPTVTLKDGPHVMEMTARTASPEEKAEWWPRATSVWPPYDEYLTKTAREIPLVILEAASELRSSCTTRPARPRRRHQARLEARDGGPSAPCGATARPPALGALGGAGRAHRGPPRARRTHVTG